MNPNLFRALTAIFAIATALLGIISGVTELSPGYAKTCGLITAILLGIKEVVVIIGDVSDDGVRNNSFDPGKRVGVVIALLSCLMLVSCAEPLTKEAAQAIAKDVVVEAGLGVADVGLSVARTRLLKAELDLQEALANPEKDVKSVLAKQLAVELAKKALEAAVRAVAKERAKRDAKQPVDVQPGSGDDSSPNKRTTATSRRVSIPAFAPQVVAALSAR